MDYSLLIAIENLNPLRPPSPINELINRDSAQMQDTSFETEFDFDKLNTSKIDNRFDFRQSLQSKVTEGTLTGLEFAKELDKMHRFTA